jgi:hypothetical protein
VLASKVDQPLGRTTEVALPQERLKEKFENCANRAVTPEATAAVYASVMALDTLADVRAVNDAMTVEPHPRRTAAALRA